MVNNTTLLGHLGQDPEVRHLDGGRAKTNFTIATSETFKNREGERVTHTEWHNVIAWGATAEIAGKYLKKGSLVYIEGKLTHRAYDNEGTKRYITEVVVRNLTLMPRKQDQPAADATP